MFRLKHAIHGNYPPFLGTQISISRQQKNSCSNSWPVRICSWQPPSDSRPSFLFLFNIYIYSYNILPNKMPSSYSFQFVFTNYGPHGLSHQHLRNHHYSLWHGWMSSLHSFVLPTLLRCMSSPSLHFSGTGYMLPFSPVFIFFVGRTLWTSPQDACTSWRYSSPLMKEHSTLLWIWVEPHVALPRIRLFSSISITITDPLTANGYKNRQSFSVQWLIISFLLEIATSWGIYIYTKFWEDTDSELSENRV